MNIKDFRNKKGITQHQVAHDLNIGRASYNRYELGLTEPNIETLIKLADYFHVTVDALLGHEVPYLLDRSLLTNEQNNIIEIVKQLDPEACNMLNAYAEGILAAKKKQTVSELIKRGF